MKLKGKTIIELTNVNTGEVEHYEDENIVTNALSEVFKPVGPYLNPGWFINNTGSNSTEYDILTLYHDHILPYYQSLTGGVLLFDSQIPESEDTIYAPATAKMVGCGSYKLNNDTANNVRGNYNIDESSAEETVLPTGIVKYVYDFPTSKANGTISCVCLTSKQGGLCGCGAMDINIKCLTNKSAMCYRLTNKNLVLPIKDRGYNDTQKENGVTLFPIIVDLEKDIVFCMRIDSTTQITIVEVPAHTKSISFFDDPLSIDASGCPAHQITLDTPLLGQQGNYFSYNVDLKQNKLYVMSSGSAYTSVVLETINLQDYSVTGKEITSPDNYEVLAGYATNHSQSYCLNNILYALGRKGSSSNYTYNILQISIENGTLLCSIPVPEQIFPSYGMNGRIYWQNNHNVFCVIENDTNLYRIEAPALMTSDSTVVPIVGRSCYMIGKTSIVYMPSNYLATINNLAQPITKTAEKTMKLTYILQKAESE